MENKPYDNPVVGSNRTKCWYLDGKLHRTDGPAVEWPDGTKQWYLDDKLHRTDGPACEGADGEKHWCLNGKLHRTDGPAIEYADGTKRWYLFGAHYEDPKVFKVAIEVLIALFPELGSL